MTMRNAVLVLLTLGVLAACTRVTMFGHTVKDEAPARVASAVAPKTPVAQQTVQQAGQPLITRLIVDYTPAASKQTAADDRFNGDALYKAASEGLAARGLANLATPAVVRVAAVEVDEFDVRATSNVVLMGRVASAGVLGATIRIRDGSGAELRRIHVRAELALNIRSADKNPLENLYKGFIGQVADELTGTVRQSPAQAR